VLLFRETSFSKKGSCWLSPDGKILGLEKKDMDGYDSIEHKFFAKDNYKLFGFTKDDLKNNSASDLLEMAVCRDWITARWGAPPTKNTHGYIFFRLSTVNRVKKRLNNLLLDLLKITGNDVEISIEEYGTIPFKSPPKNVFHGTPKEYFKESCKRKQIK